MGHIAPVTQFRDNIAIAPGGILKRTIQVLALLLIAAPALAQEDLGYSCSVFERLPLGELRLNVSFDLQGNMRSRNPLPSLGSQAQWSISLKDSGGQLVELDYDFPGNDLSKTPVLGHALFAKGWRNNSSVATFYVTLNSGERIMGRPSPYDLQTQDPLFLSALGKATSIAFDLINPDGTSVAHHVLDIPEPDRQAAMQSLTMHVAELREKAKDYPAQCRKLTFTFEQF